MLDIIIRPWVHAFTFQGRTTRTEYWLFTLQLIIVIACEFILLLGAAGSSGMGEIGFVGAIILIASFAFAFIANLTATVRRLHDQDKTGWFYLVQFIPMVGGLIFFVMTLWPGTPGENSYGYDPREGDYSGSMARVFS